jgi:hypothetical protein
MASFDCEGGTALTFERERILILLRNVLTRSDVLSGHTHVERVERAGQAVLHETDPVLLSPTRPRKKIGRATHDLCTDPNRDVQIAKKDIPCRLGHFPSDIFLLLSLLYSP